MINVAILGYGTVGSGVFEVLNENKESISRRAGQELHVKYVLLLGAFFFYTSIGGGLHYGLHQCKSYIN